MPPRGMACFGDNLARAAIGCAAFFASVAAQAAPQTATVRVVTIAPTSIVNTAPLDFGTIIPAAAAGTVSINAQTGARTSTVVTLAGGTFSRAQFVAAGTPLRTVTLTLNPSPTITISNGSNSMTINQLRVSVDGGTAQPFGPNHVIGVLGVINFDVGGRLNVGANQAPGLYAGSFTLTMDYQ
jgi:spore coat protein U-like protein